MATAAVIAFWFATLLYGAATVLYAYHFLSKRPAYSWYATFFTGAGFLCHTASIGMRSIAEDGTRLDGQNQLILLAWALVLVYFVVEHLVKIKVYGVLLVPAGSLLMVVSQFFARKGAAPVSPLVENWKIGIHVAMIVFANAGFIVGAVASLAYLIQERQLKLRKTSMLFKRLPPLASIDLLARRAIAFAFPAYTAGLMLGIVRAYETDQQGWWADPRVMLAGLVWAAFGTYLALHYSERATARTTARLAIVGAVLVAVLAIVARTVPAGFHVFGV
ncbi:MAG: cytochrome c biogenesis protein CcsA [Coriobacteriia bacterium]|nr:cytochrome c biogenesis protein CcsA [Coriobacteriia bacterium]MDI6842841.1 cytochrome c biogenesis protein CcsA [Anaerosomatales bacterium]GAV31691.1 ABC-type transport system [Coriobacteriaceae bacterium EMTCatB1]